MATSPDVFEFQVPKREAAFSGDIVLVGGAPFVVMQRLPGGCGQVTLCLDRGVQCGDKSSFSRVLALPEDIRAAWQSVAEAETPGPGNGMWEREAAPQLSSVSNAPRKPLERKRRADKVCNDHLAGTRVGEELQRALKQIKAEASKQSVPRG